jgi:hypothetical protein
MKSVTCARAPMPHSKKPLEKKKTKLLGTAETGNTAHETLLCG